MTLEEKLIVSAYTGVLMTDIGIFRAWLSEKGYPDPMECITPGCVEEVMGRMKDLTKDDFLKLCEEDTE